jgi:ribonuclease HI
VPWRKARFKDVEVLARCDADGKLAAEAGRVEIRYRATDKRAYRAGERNLSPIAGGEVLPDDAVVEAEPAPDKARGATDKARAQSGRTPAAAKPGAIIAYADGACSGNPGPAGIGIVLVDGRSRRELSDYLGNATNNIAELTAIERALTEIGEVERPVSIYTDSQYAIGVLTKGWKAKANGELVARLRSRVQRMKDVSFHYVRGHSGIALNERADELAVEAVKRREPGEWVQVAS